MSKQKLTPADFDCWETPPGVLFDLEEDEEKPPAVAKSYTEIRKFNPFHDARGRFSDKNGFASYSANPKTRAGAMAISRSNASGHGRTMNVHRESKGESVAQNAKWLATGQKPKVPAAVSRARYQQRKLKQQQAQRQAALQRQQAAKNPPQQGNNIPAAKKPPQAPQKPTQPKHQMAQGKDISHTFRPDPNSSMKVFDQVAKQQGFDKKPQVLKQAEFDAAVKASGIIAYRSWDPGVDVITGKATSADGFKRMFMEADSIQAAGSGARAYGGGTYIATNPNAQKGKTPSPQAAYNARSESRDYIGSRGVTATITLSPNAKVADYGTIRREFAAEPLSVQRAFSQKSRYGARGTDYGAYAAARGYDAMRAVGAGWNCDYMTIFNRTKAIVLDD